MDLNELRELIRIVEQSTINELSLENSGVKIVLKKNCYHELKNNDHENLDSVTAGQKKELKEYTPVYSPMVGIFYRAPAPDAPPFVRKGEIVKKGQTLCIIEAMKLMNEIEAEVDGEIIEILVDNGQPVEYGQQLMLIRAI